MNVGMRIRVALVALTVASILPMMAAAGAAAQAANSQVMLGNLDVTWSEPWSKLDTGSASGEGWEQVQLTGPVGVVMIETSVPAVPAEEMRDELLARHAENAPLQRVDELAEGPVSVTLDIIQYPDAPYGLIVFVQEDPGGTQMLVLGAPIPQIADELASAQASITVSGVPAFGGLDAQHLQHQFDAAAQGGAAGTTPVQQGSVGTTPAAQGTTSAGTGSDGASVPIGDSSIEGQPASGPIAFSKSGWSVNWTGDWQAQASEDGYLSLWSPTSRADLMITEYEAIDPDAASFAKAEIDFRAQSGETGWSTVSVVDLVPGSRYIVVMSRSHTSTPLYNVYDVTLENGTMRAVMLEAWAPDLSRALDAARRDVTINDAPILADVTLPMDLSAVPPADPSSLTLFESGAEVRWTGAWAEQRTYIARIALSSGEDTFPQVTVSQLENTGKSAEEWATTFAGPGSGFLQHAAMDLDNGERKVIVLDGASLSPVSMTYLLISIERTVTPNRLLLQAIEVDRDAAAEQVAWAQANVTVNGEPIFADATTIFPEVFAATGAGGQTATTPTPVAVDTTAPAQGDALAAMESYTVGIDGTVLTWDAGAWTLNEMGSSYSTAELTTRGPLGIAIGYHPLELPFGTGAVDAESYGVYMANLPERNVEGYDYQYMGTADVVAADGTKIWIVVAVVTDTVRGDHYHIEECYMKPGASACVVALIPRDNLHSGVQVIRDTVTINGEVPFRHVEQATPALFG
jgi:hypothetical protein